MSKLHIKKGDEVIVLAGKNKNSKGKVLKVLVKEEKAIVEGVNMVSKRTKPNAQNHDGKNVIRVSKKSGEEIK